MKMTKAPCPDCNREQNCSIVREFRTEWSSHHGEIGGADYYRIYQCKGCDRVFFGHSSFFSEDFDHEHDPVTGEWNMVSIERKTFYPEQTKRSLPSWHRSAFGAKHELLDRLLIDVYQAFDNGSNALAAMGIRTCFDLTASALQIDDDIPFNEKIEQLRKGGHISPREKKLLEALVDAGSAASHRSWMPKDEDIDLLLDALEGFIQRTIILPEGLDELTERVPAKKKQP